MKAVFTAILNYFRNTDKFLIGMCLIASAFSSVLIMGICNSGYAKASRVDVQIIASLLGIIMMVVISKIDYRLIARLWKFHSALAYALIVLTYFVGEQRDDDKAWLRLPLGLTFQPAELLKISFIVTFALHLQYVKDSLNQPRTLLTVCAHGLLPFLFIMLQGDAGTALVFLCIFVFMLFAAGLDLKYVAMALGSSVALAPFAWFFVMDEHKRKRVMTIFNPDLDPLGVGLQQRYGRRALGSGQIWGKGIFYGKHQYVPEMHNDFIFTFIGESLGFMGCMAVVILITAIALRILTTANVSDDNLGKYICVGVFAMLAFQIVANVGMCLSLLPVIGITLPLFSAGGTSVVATYLGIGLALSVYMNNKKNLFSDK